MSGSIKVLNSSALAELAEGAQQSLRKRNHQLWHASHQESVQRIAMWLEPGTYVRPHLHPQPEKWEAMLLLQGALRLVTFDEAGDVTGTIDMRVGENPIVEIPPQHWHTLIALEPALVFEIKPGPFDQPQPEDFAQWAPMEGDEDCGAYIEYWKVVAVGEKGSPTNHLAI